MFIPMRKNMENNYPILNDYRRLYFLHLALMRSFHGLHGASL